MGYPAWKSCPDRRIVLLFRQDAALPERPRLEAPRTLLLLAVLLMGSLPCSAQISPPPTLSGTFSALIQLTGVDPPDPRGWHGAGRVPTTPLTFTGGGQGPIISYTGSAPSNSYSGTYQTIFSGDTYVIAQPPDVTTRTETGSLQEIVLTVNLTNQIATLSFGVSCVASQYNNAFTLSGPCCSPVHYSAGTNFYDGYAMGCGTVISPGMYPPLMCHLITNGGTFAVDLNSSTNYYQTNGNGSAEEVTTSGIVSSTPSLFTVSLLADPKGGGTLSGGGTYPSGSTATVSATANSAYQFLNWTKDGSVVSSSPSYQFTVIENLTLVGNFAPIITVKTLDPDNQEPVPPQLPPSVLRINATLNGWTKKRQFLLLKVQGPPNAPLRTYIAAVANTGGHQHGTLSRPHGWLSLAQPSATGPMSVPSFYFYGNSGFLEGGATGYGSYADGLPFQTGSFGAGDIYYIAPEIAGQEMITVSTEDPNPSARVTASVVMTIAVPGLSELPASPNIEPTGLTTVHPLNHFGSNSLIQAVQALALNYAAEARDNTGSLPSSALPVNDMSLPQGGLFDIILSDSVPTYPEWHKPHIGHRLGFEVDIGNQSSGHGLIPGAYSAFERIWRQQSCFQRIPEGSHYHFVLTAPGRATIDSPDYWKAVVDFWEPNTRIITFTITNDNRGGIPADAVRVTDVEYGSGVSAIGPPTPISLGPLGIRQRTGLTLQAAVPKGVTDFFVSWRGMASSAVVPGSFKFPQYGYSIIRRIDVPSEPTPIFRHPLSANEGQWDLELTNANQPAVVGTPLVYSGLIDNRTGTNVLINGMSFQFYSPAVEQSYVLDWAPELIKTGGLIPVNGYRGPLFTLRWLAAPPVASMNSGEAYIVADSPAVPQVASAAFASPFELQQIMIRPETNDLVVWWVSTATNSILEATDDLSSSDEESPVWLPVDVPVHRNAGTNEVRLSPSEISAFYRLNRQDQ